MRIATRHNPAAILLAALLASGALIPSAAWAQSEKGASDATAADGDSEESALKQFKPRRNDRERQQGGKSVKISPYIDASQVLLAELKPDRDLLTYTMGFGSVMHKPKQKRDADRSAGESLVGQPKQERIVRGQEQRGPRGGDSRDGQDEAH